MLVNIVGVYMPGVRLNDVDIYSGRGGEGRWWGAKGGVYSRVGWLEMKEKNAGEGRGGKGRRERGDVIIALLLAFVRA